MLKRSLSSGVSRASLIFVEPRMPVKVVQREPASEPETNSF